MSSPPLHPDHLGPGSMVSPWRILEVLGAGGFGRAFKVEREDLPGQLFTLKMALRPMGPHAPEEEDIDGRMAREVAVHMAYATDLCVHSMDRWPTARGYFYFVTDFVDGEPFHVWRWRVKPSAGRLLEVFTELVRRVGQLHRRGVCHRDLKSENILIRKGDETPFILDYGTVRLPGMATLTVGIPPASPHLLPPECVTFLSQGTWQQGAHFDAGIPGDLYALGTLLYEALTDGHPFSPKLSYDKLLPAIATVRPNAPHLVNAKVPRGLSEIALRLLEKRPEDRYPDTDALLQALWKASKEKKRPEWQQSAERPPQEPPVASPLPEASVSASIPRDAEAMASPPGSASPPAASLKWGQGRWRWSLAVTLGAVGGFLALWLARTTLAPPPEKGSLPVPSSITPSDATDASSSIRAVTVWLCATVGLACASAPVVPERADCPPEATRAMFEVLGLSGDTGFAQVDIHQPGGFTEVGLYQDGAVVGRVTSRGWKPPKLPVGTLLRGRLWTGKGITDAEGAPAAIGRYTEAELPDGRRLPVCLELDGALIGDGRLPWLEGSKPGAVVLPREIPIFAVHRWH